MVDIVSIKREPSDELKFESDILLHNLVESIPRLVADTMINFNIGGLRKYNIDRIMLRNFLVAW